MGMKMKVVFAAVLLQLALYQCQYVRVPPSIITGPEKTGRRPQKHILFKIDDKISLPCVATGVPEPKYEWYRDGAPMDLDNYTNIVEDPAPGRRVGSIVITEARSLDEGYYQCRVENEHGVAMSQVVFLQRARLETRDTVVPDVKKHTVTEGQPLTLPCNTRQTQSLPAPEYSWSTVRRVGAKRQTDINLNKRINIDEKGNLYFSYVQPEDAKNGHVYRCSIINRELDLDTKGFYGEVIVNAKPVAMSFTPEIMYHTPDVIAVKGREQRLKCLFRGKPEVTVTWGRNASDDLPRHHRVQFFTTELVINPVALDDDAVYSCTGTNDVGSATQEINVTVEVEPEFESASGIPRELIVTEGGVAEFRCWVFAIPDAKIEWFSNGRPLKDVKPADRYQISHDGRNLIISDVCIDCPNGESDTGYIQCNASNVHGYAYDGGYLHISTSGPPSMIRGPEMTDEGPLKHRLYKTDSKLSLQCVATGDPEPRYDWYFNGERLFDWDWCSYNIIEDPNQNGTGSIKITAAFGGNEGYYQCRAENNQGVAMSEVVFLQRVTPPSQPKDKKVKPYQVSEGQHLKLPCNNTGLSTPVVKYSWSISKTSVIMSKRINIDDKGNLYFAYVTQEDATNSSVYKCNIYNTFLDASTSLSDATIEVNTNVSATDLPPEIMYHTADAIAIKGREKRLKCLFKGKPEVTISWKRDTSDDLPSHHRVQSFTTELVINPVALDDQAVYKCTGTNIMGSATQEFNVTVEVEPEFERASDRPRDLNVTDGGVAEFHCRAFAIPDAKVEWFINGRPINDDRYQISTDGRNLTISDRYQISTDGRNLTISDVCQDCSDGTSDNGYIQCNASNVHGYVYDGAYLRIRRSITITDGPDDTDMKYGEIIVLNCLATSDESTHINYTWYFDGNYINYTNMIWAEENYTSSLVIKTVDEETAKEFIGEYTCEASDGYSTANASAVVQLPQPGLANSMTPATRALAGVAGGLLVLLLVVVLVFIYLRKHACLRTAMGKSGFGAGLLDEANATLDELLRCSFDEDMLFKLNQLRLPRSCITLTEQIGKGAFGMVWKAVYNKIETSRIVAAKMVQGSFELEDVVPILAEALLMGELRHRNVMGLLGVVIDEEPLLVLPFMSNGDLHSYLRSSRFAESTDIKSIEPQELLVFGRQIARGMEYLGSQRIIHRDLACRNCMLNANLVVKVADFGLSKDVYETNYYRQIHEFRLPIKWLAVECLVDRVFTTQSDVWAFGVTLWEIFTLARTPYPSLDNSEVLNYVRKGGRLDQPDDCPDQMFSLMSGCWDEAPSKRPTFSELAESIDQYLAAEMGYIVVTEPDDAEIDVPLLYEVVDGDDGNNGDDKGKEDGAPGGAPDGDKIVALDLDPTSPEVNA